MKRGELDVVVGEVTVGVVVGRLEVFFHLALCEFSSMAAARRSPVFHEPSPDDGRQRDIFPLPLIEEEVGMVEKKAFAGQSNSEF